PFDWDIVRTSLAKTGKVAIVEESPKRGGIGAEIGATIAEDMADLLMAPIRRVAAPNTPAPFSPPMEKFYIPSVERIAEAARATMAC
ncbi:MAG: alpha-ketoacid dehydrogenase subunit beta, partial [Lentisphaerae bacterium]|nr:alpha-ketoacid dehydrogenase subunit beta [Lentisphaerota bacterium]